MDAPIGNTRYERGSCRLQSARFIISRRMTMFHPTLYLKILVLSCVTCAMALHKRILPPPPFPKEDSP